MEMTTPLPMYVFTSQIPTLDIVQAGTDPLQVALWAGSTKLLETTLYPVAGCISLHDIGKLYERFLRDRDSGDAAPYAVFELEVENNVWEDNMVIYCPYNCNLPAEEFIQGHFLTSLAVKRIPADASRDDEALAYLLTSAETETARTIVVTADFRTPDGGFVSHACSFTDDSRELYGSIVACPEEVTSIFGHYCQEATEYDWHDLVPLSYTVRMGQRAMTYYVDLDFMPSVRFRFRNAFNVDETMYLEGVTVTRTETERSMATSHGTNLFYDQVDSQEYEVTTAPLSTDEAKWATQLLLSHRVRRVEEDGSLTEVLITDMNAEVTDSDEEYRRLKFTYQMAREGATLRFSRESSRSSRFTGQFTLHFG